MKVDVCDLDRIGRPVTRQGIIRCKSQHGQGPAKGAGAGGQCCLCDGFQINIPHQQGGIINQVGNIIDNVGTCRGTGIDKYIYGEYDREQCQQRRSKQPDAVPAGHRSVNGFIAHLFRLKPGLLLLQPF